MPKQLLTLRLDPEMIAQFKARGPGWQGEVSVAMREWLERQQSRADLTTANIERLAAEARQTRSTRRAPLPQEPKSQP